MELGITTFAETYPDPRTGEKVGHGERLRNVLEEIVLADQVGLEVYGVGEHHRPDFASSSPAVVLAAAAGMTSKIRLTPAVVILSSDDPVRVFQDYATLDLVSDGRAELLVGRGSFIESFPLFGYSLSDYDELFSEKLDLLLAIRDQERVTWSGRFRPPLQDQAIYPRPQQDPFPIWVGVGGSPESIVRAATRGLPVALAIIGGNPDRFAFFADLHRKTLVESGHDPASAPLAVHAHGYIADSDEQGGRRVLQRLRGGDDPAGERARVGTDDAPSVRDDALPRRIVGARRRGDSGGEDQSDEGGPRHRPVHAPHQCRHPAPRASAPRHRAVGDEGGPAVEDVVAQPSATAKESRMSSA